MASTHQATSPGSRLNRTGGGEGAAATNGREAAEAAGLVYTSDDRPGIRRRRAGSGWVFLGPDGSRLTDKAELQRIKSLAIPPAYTDVWICPDPNGHLQATGRDARGRKQYRYHPRFREVSESNKYQHMLAFAEALPRLRERIAADMARPGLPREKVLATIVHLLEATLIRVGNDDYARENRSFGLTTLRNRHVRVEGAELRFRFRGKSGKEWSLALKDRRVARIVKASQDLPGQHLFQYLDEKGERREVTSTDVNSYLKAIAGASITAKDFRTWAGTVLAALALSEAGETEGRTAINRQIRAAIAQVASRLGNTPTICRKCYVHPEILACYLDRDLRLRLRDEVGDELAQPSRLRPEEQAVLELLHRRLGTPGREAPGPAG